jgi:hypothetical protein
MNCTLAVCCVYCAVRLMSRRREVFIEYFLRKCIYIEFKQVCFVHGDYCGCLSFFSIFASRPSLEVQIVQATQFDFLGSWQKDWHGRYQYCVPCVS